MKIKKISSVETYPVRHEVLRKGKPIETCQFKDDDDENTTHFGLYLEDKLVGIISIFKEKNNLFSKTNQFQIRGMAVLEEFQGKGLGVKLVKEAENHCISLNADLIWFNARENAVPFYEKLDYKIIGDSFLIPDVGIHFAMYKKTH
jgi:GNAT superfamily N-acetyltransferase